MGLKADGKTVQHAMLKRCTKHISLNWKVKYAALYSTGLLGSWTFLFSLVVLYILMCLILLLMGLKAYGETVQHAMFKRCTTHTLPDWKVKYAALHSAGL